MDNAVLGVHEHEHCPFDGEMMIPALFYHILSAYDHGILNMKKSVVLRIRRNHAIPKEINMALAQRLSCICKRHDLSQAAGACSKEQCQLRQHEYDLKLCLRAGESKEQVERMKNLRLDYIPTNCFKPE